MHTHEKSRLDTTSDGLPIKREHKDDDDGVDLPSNYPGNNAGWTAEEIILVDWRLQRNPNPANSYATIDTTDAGLSGVYSNARLQAIAGGQFGQAKDYLGNMQLFVTDLANGTLATAPDQLLHTTNLQVGPNDVVVWYHSYIVFVTDTRDPWEWMQGVDQDAINTKAAQNPANYLTNINHLAGANLYPHVGNKVCNIAYFSAYCPPDDTTSNQLNLFVDYRPATGTGTGVQYIQGYFDPAIKNDGHGDGHGTHTK